MTHQLKSYLVRFTLLLGAAAGVTQARAGIPEPSVVFYGRVTLSPATTEYIPATVQWTVSGNGDTSSVSDTRLVIVGSEVFYVSHVPFETRALGNGTPLAATPNTIGLTAANTTYTRSALVDGRNAVLPAGAGTFSYGAAVQGKMEQLDLIVGETFTEWSQRLFGGAINGSADADGDGRTNYQEFLAGTDPHNASDYQRVKTFVALGGGSFRVAWTAVAGRAYSVERTSNLATGPWTSLWQGTATATGDLTFTDTPPNGQPRMFYRVVVTAP